VPENALPVDQNVTETALEIAEELAVAGFVGSKVVVTGTLASEFIGALRDRHLISQDLLLVTSVSEPRGG
jgi:hypothetical protein